MIFGLTHHDLVFRPGSPSISRTATTGSRCSCWRRRAVRSAGKVIGDPAAPAMVLAVCAFLALFLSDNLLWFTTFADPAAQWHALALTPFSMRRTSWIGWLGTKAPRSTWRVRTSESDHLTPTYTDLRAWRGHDYSTPEVALRTSRAARGILRWQTAADAQSGLTHIPQLHQNRDAASGSQSGVLQQFLRRVAVPGRPACSVGCSMSGNR